VTRRCRAALLALLTACGGQVGERRGTGGASAAGDPSAPGGVSGAPLDEPPLIASSGQTSSGDAGGETVLATAGAGGSDAGAASVDETGPLIGSATRYCVNELYCFGLDCYAPADLEAKVCVAACATDADCATNEVCLESADLKASCYPRCDTPFDCEYGFDCFDFANTQQMLVCFPTPWASLWARERR
jgi:hypothetical protein